MTTIPRNIEKEHIIQAIKEIDSNGIPEKRKSKNHFIIHNGKRYPQKYVLSLANTFVNGNELKDFSANQAQNFFKKLHIDIDEKITSDSFTDDDMKEIYASVRSHISSMYASIKKQKSGELKPIPSNEDVDINECVVFPKINDVSIEELAQIYRDIEEGKSDKHPIHIPSSFNVIPSSPGDCRENLVGFIIT